MKQQEHHLGTDGNGKSAGKKELKPWRTPEVLEADYSITADGPVAGTDRFFKGIS